MTETLDREALRAKYRAERDKRLRPDGANQYIKPTGRFAHLLEDPYTEVVDREPVTDHVTVALIGGGFSGLCVGARCKQAGIDDLRIIESGGDFGGVWYWNRYPGAMCDTAAMIYLPLLEETGYLPSKKYVFGPEIYEHALRIAETFDLYDNALLSTRIETLEWDEEKSVWRITTNRGDDFTAKYVTMGTGPISEPKLPGIPGIERFGGHSFHTARWDYAYTGGGPSDPNLSNLADKRVGIIGTGATAVQCIPALAASSKELFVFQRTPSSIDVRNNHPLDPDELGDLGPGWQTRWLENFATLQTGGVTDVDLVKDGWTDIAQRIRDRIFQAMTDASQEGGDIDPALLIAQAYEDSDDEKMNEIRARVDAIVQDPETAEALKPWYRQLCKRPCFHDEYLQSYNTPGTHLIDTNGKGVERIDETGIWANGEHYELDCIVFASGFEVHLSHSADYETVGRDGRTLSEYWTDGMRTLHGLQSDGFPNLFIIGLSQGANLISNITHNLSEAGKTVGALIRHAEDTGASEIEATPEAVAAWVDQFKNSERRGFLGNADCTPGYYNNEGAEPTDADLLNASGYPAGPVAFFHHMDRWRNSGDFTGVEFR